MIKRFMTLILAAGLVFGVATGASAIDFKAKGQWIMSFDYGEGMSGYKRTSGGGEVYGSGFGNPSQDMFEAEQRVRLQLDAVASETLSGTVYFEIGESVWGNASQGAALGADGNIIELKNAYIDWAVPHTDIKVRMGIQSIALPAFATESSQVLNDDMAGIVISNAFNDMVSATVFWARPYNDNFTGDANGNNVNFLDNVDVFGLLLPMTFHGAKVTPWLTYTAVGQNFARSWDDTTNASSLGNAFNYVYTGLLPVGMEGRMVNGSRATSSLFAYGDVINAGLTGELTMWDPLRIAWDFNYGEATYGVDALDRGGFYGSLLFEYKMDWGIPGLYGWYSSGDDDDVKNGSERMASIDASAGDITFSNLAFSGNPYIARENIMGTTLIGTWGIGARVKDFSFLENMRHTFRVNFINGTNSTEMAKYLRGAKETDVYGFTTSSNTQAAFDTAAGMYLTTADSAMEFGLTTQYDIYENFELVVDANYLALWLCQDNYVWGDSFTATDAWNINATFVYSF